MIEICLHFPGPGTFKGLICFDLTASRMLSLVTSTINIYYLSLRYLWREKSCFRSLIEVLDLYRLQNHLMITLDIVVW